MPAGNEVRGRSPNSSGSPRTSLRRVRAPTPNFRQKGFTYLSLLLVVAVTGGVLAAIGELWSHAAQREREAELLAVGAEIRQAIGAYYERSPGGAKRYPEGLEELLEDKRYPVKQRYLRRIYPDPITGSPDWGLIEAPTGGVMGVYSRSELEPIRRGNFPKEDESFAQATRYSDWKFFYAPPEIAPQSQLK